jgi:hypothetical protein
MQPLTKQHVLRVEAAYQALRKVHPEIDEGKAMAARLERATKAIPGLDALGDRLLGIVDESAGSGADKRKTRVIHELVALTEGRPAILVRNDDYDLAPHRNLPDVLSGFLTSQRTMIQKALKGVGRIEVLNHPRRAWLGTGFMIDLDGRDLLVTNRHVAIELAFRGLDGSFQFIDGLLPGKVTARLDLKEEVGSVADDDSSSIPIVEVLHIEDEYGPDLAILKVGEPRARLTPTRLRVGAGVKQGDVVAAIGYPAKDTSATDLQIVLNLLGDVFDRKRLAPGVVKSVSATILHHDCSTLGGNSGSPLVCLRTGEVLGLHTGGVFPNPMNLAVPAQLLAERASDAAKRKRRPSPESVVRPANESAAPPAPPRPQTQLSVRGGVTIELPLRITVELCGPNEVATTRVAGSAQGPSTMTEAVEALRRGYGHLPGVANVRSGLDIANQQLTGDPVVVVAIDHTRPGSDQTIAALPREIGIFPVRARPVTLSDLMGSLALERAPRIRYNEPPGLSLEPVKGNTDAVFHVSPEAGWKHLKDFLSGTERSLTIGLYNVSAEHVGDHLVSVLKEPRTLALVLGDATLDKEETDAYERALVKRLRTALKDRFSHELADGERRLFAGHYHIKVVVRDSKAIWLSSGNWEPSNQPDVDPLATGDKSWDLLRERNREWHAIIVNEQLARTFEAYIRHDLASYRKLREEEAPPARTGAPRFLVPTMAVIEEAPRGPARYFAPLTIPSDDERLRIQPLLTPDNFLDHVTPLIERAETSIDLQNQTLKWQFEHVHERFEKFMSALLERNQAGVRVRIIIRGDYDPGMKELLVGHGFDPRQVRLLSKCHTKGIVVDSKYTVLGSHNLSEHGALVNRDASLLITHPDVARYFAEIFQFDWDRASTRVQESPPGIRVHHPGEAVPSGWESVALEELL